MRVASSLSMRMLFVWNSGVFNCVLFRPGHATEAQSAIAEKHQRDLPRHVKGGQERTENAEIKWPVRDAPFVGTVQNLVFAPETGKEQRKAAQRQHANGIGGKCHRHEFSQSAHAAHILFL